MTEPMLEDDDDLYGSADVAIAGMDVQPVTTGSASSDAAASAVMGTANESAQTNNSGIVGLPATSSSAPDTQASLALTDIADAKLKNNGLGSGSGPSPGPMSILADEPQQASETTQMETAPAAVLSKESTSTGSNGQKAQDPQDQSIGNSFAPDTQSKPASTEHAHATLSDDSLAQKAGTQNALLQAALLESQRELAQAPDEAEAALVQDSTMLVDARPTQTDAAPEFEPDSSPYVSSTDDDSDSSSSRGDSDDEYQLLDPHEQARMLMADAGSDDEASGGKGDGRGNGPRTQNEQPDEIVEMPSLDITPDMPIEELGHVQVILDNVALVKGKTTGEYQVLESSSVLCLENRKLIGVVAETIGRVEEPMYVVRFTNIATLQEMGVKVNEKIFFVPSHSHFLFTKALQVKGSDASNLHDEEVGAEEVDFSDDEAEAAFKSALKRQRQAKREAKTGVSSSSGRGASRGGRRPLAIPSSGPSELSYDDSPTDGPYNPLPRPTDILQGSPAPHAHSQRSTWSSRGGGRGRGRGSHQYRGRGQGSVSSHGTNRTEHALPAPPTAPAPAIGAGPQHNYIQPSYNHTQPQSQPYFGQGPPGHMQYPQPPSQPPPQMPVQVPPFNGGFPYSSPQQQYFGMPNMNLSTQYPTPQPNVAPDTYRNPTMYYPPNNHYQGQYQPQDPRTNGGHYPNSNPP